MKALGKKQGTMLIERILS